jgi:dienelactone hydrolase
MATTSAISYFADDRSMIGHLAVPDAPGTYPAVLVAHEGPGLDDHAKGRADRLADLGYVAFALDYHGGGKPIADRTAMTERLMALINDQDRTRAIAQAALAVLVSQPQVDRSRVAAIGYCFGGTMSLELARSGADLKAVVGFHSGLASARPEDASNITAKILVCIGSEDPLVPAAQRADFEAEMRAAGVDWRMNLYGRAVHSFTNPRASEAGLPFIAYDQLTDERSWRAMLDFFAEVGM